MLENEVFVTQEGLERMEAELDELKSVKRKEMADRIKVALEFGDISENSEYDEAKNEQAKLEEKIAKLEMMLSNAKVIDEEKLDTSIVSLGSKVKIKDLEYNEVEEYTVVGSAEADPLEGRISNESPVGKAILGHKKGETVEIEVMGQKIKYKIMSIGR